MADYQHTLRHHDSTWILQGELRLNDALMQAGRSRKPKSPDHNADVLLTLNPNPTDELEAAGRAVRRMTGRLGLDAAAVAEVLDMLGLPEVTA
ncbi:hypothetical protein [Streptosporangium sp. NPDC003464]